MLLHVCVCVSSHKLFFFFTQTLFLHHFSTIVPLLGSPSPPYSYLHILFLLLIPSSVLFLPDKLSPLLVLFFSPQARHSDNRAAQRTGDGLGGEGWMDRVL